MTEPNDAVIEWRERREAAKIGMSVFIQWLTYHNLLVEWIDAMIDSHHDDEDDDEDDFKETMDETIEEMLDSPETFLSDCFEWDQTPDEDTWCSLSDEWQELWEDNLEQRIKDYER